MGEKVSRDNFTYLSDLFLCLYIYPFTISKCLSLFYYCREGYIASETRPTGRVIKCS